MIQQQDNGIYRARALDGFDWLEHGFGTRLSIWPEPERLALLKQVHSTFIVEASSPGVQGEGDALITNEPGLLVGVSTADCVPVLIVDERNRAVAAVHAGWRGTSSELVLRTLELMQDRFATDAGNVYAAIGPCISRCCFEVGPDVADRFLEWLPELQRGRKQKIDLVEANRRQLMRWGIPEWRVESGAPCTFCRPEELHSFRRDGAKAGRLISAIGLREKYQA